METTAIWTAWAWIGWVVTTLILAALWWLTGLLGKDVYLRLRRLYHWNVLAYWLSRLEREGKCTFEKPDAESPKHKALTSSDEDYD